MNDEVVETKAQTQMSFGVEIEVSSGMRGSNMERKGIGFGEEVKASGKTTEMSRWWDKEKREWGEVEVIELSSDDED